MVAISDCRLRFLGATDRQILLRVSPTLSDRGGLGGLGSACQSWARSPGRKIGEGGAENSRFASKAPNALTFFLSDGFIEKVRLLVRPPLTDSNQNTFSIVAIPDLI
jgi:hypothetical protein